MKANEINLEKDGHLFNVNICPPRSHYKHLMKMGRVFPSTKSQAKTFIKMGVYPDVYNMDDVEFVEKELGSCGFRGGIQIYAKPAMGPGTKSPRHAQCSKKEI